MSNSARIAAKILVSVGLIYHLCGIVLAPASVPPSPQIFRELYPGFRSYLELINLNQGNHFFAPDPGASTLISYVVETADGSSVTGRMPDPKTSPRLLYHRHFMVTESLAGADFQDPNVRRLLTRALARQLLRQHRGQAVVLSRVTHELPSFDQVRAGAPLDAPESYVEEPLGRFAWTDFFD